ncbi:ATP-binding cassette domain-containing protein [Micromonospora sp. NPDC005087]|uniref:branched-chain amino acid ABC transporter ATP-binding protein/permease n=1 Tax=Micromonospora sp. NPDC005087 TaxID=3364225 RepID=UPI0036A1C26C
MAALLTRARPWALPAVAVFVALLPWMGTNFSVLRQIALIAIFSLVVSGLNLSFGYAGELALGQGAIFAAGAYVTGYVSVAHGVPFLLALVAAALAALVVGVASGAAGLRLGGWALAITSFFLVLLVPDILTVFADETGGFSGLPGIRPPDLFGADLAFYQFYPVVIVIAAVWFLLFRNVVTSAHGAALKAMRDSPVLATSLGISVYRMKLVAYAIGAVPAGIAGCLFAYLDQFISPSSFTFIVAVGFFAASIIGGAASIYGAIVGAALLQLGPLQSTSFQHYSLAVYGLFLLIAGVALSGGVSGLVGSLVRRLRPKRSATAVERDTGERPPLPALPGAVLATENVSRSFGGNKAVVDVSLTAQPGRVTALIGPNGSGKTTLLNLVSGYYQPDAGAVRLGDTVLTGRKPYAVARAGVARTFQTPQVPSGLSTRQVVETGCYADTDLGWLGAALRTPHFRRVQRATRERADTILRSLGLLHVADAEASTLPLGTRRMLELARAIATGPRVLLLDEVASGLDERELDQLSAVIRELRDGGATVLLVEHNFPLVLRLADEVHVLAQGSEVVAGPPQAIATDADVLALYLGGSAAGQPVAALTEENVS